MAVSLFICWWVFAGFLFLFRSIGDGGGGGAVVFGAGAHRCGAADVVASVFVAQATQEDFAERCTASIGL